MSAFIRNECTENYKTIIIGHVTLVRNNNFLLFHTKYFLDMKSHTVEISLFLVALAGESNILVLVPWVTDMSFNLSSNFLSKENLT